MNIKRLNPPAFLDPVYLKYSFGNRKEFLKKLGDESLEKITPIVNKPGYYCKGSLVWAEFFWEELVAVKFLSRHAKQDFLDDIDQLNHIPLSKKEVDVLKQLCKRKCFSKKTKQELEKLLTLEQYHRINSSARSKIRLRFDKFKKSKTDLN